MCGSIILLLLLAFFNSSIANNSTSSTVIKNPKQLLIERFKDLVSDFLTDSQLSKTIDVAAVSMHKGKSAEEILDVLYNRLKNNMTTQQVSALQKAQKGIISDLDEKSLKVMKSRIRRMIVYSVDPAVEQIHKFATRPSMAFSLMSETTNPRFIGSVKSLVRDVLTTQEYDTLKKHCHPQIVKL